MQGEVSNEQPPPKDKKKLSFEMACSVITGKNEKYTQTLNILNRCMGL